MSDGAARFSARYPYVWHVIEADGAGPWLRDTGLLPAAALLKLAGVPDGGANREDFLRLDIGGHRTAIVRPQFMNDARLLPTLAGSFAGDAVGWRCHINGHVFFWAEERRRDAFLQACIRLRGQACAPPRVITIATAALLTRHDECAYFARINTGSTVRGGSRVRRDERTLLPVSTYRSGNVAELAIRGCVELEGARLV